MRISLFFIGLFLFSNFACETQTEAPPNNISDSDIDNSGDSGLDGDSDIDDSGDSSSYGDSGTSLTISPNGCEEIHALPPKPWDRFGSTLLENNHSGGWQAIECGTVGGVFWDSDPEDEAYDWKLIYLEVNNDEWTVEEVIAGTGQQPRKGSTLYFNGCDPEVLLVEDNTYLTFRRENAVWTEYMLDPEIEDLGNLEHFSARQNHLIAHAQINNEDRIIHGLFDGSEWSFEALNDITTITTDVDPDWNLPPDIPPENFPELSIEMLDYAFGSDGTIYAAVSINRHLYFATHSTTGWSAELVYFRPSFDEDAVQSVSLDISNSGSVAIATKHARRVITGSMADVSLWVWHRVEEQWIYDEVATHSDGFAGTDGDRFTGEEVFARFDYQDRLHVAFADIASWHNENGYNISSFGQLRYAVYHDNFWTLATLFEQSGQTESSLPVYEGTRSSLAIIENTVHSLIREALIESESPPYDNSPETTYRLMYCKATLSE